jgi:tripartite-type tricarboxylate transporter receptor subunit TctC
MTRAHRKPALIGFGLLLFAAAPAMSDPVADFYRGKTVTMIISTSPGGGYDLLGRAIARHLPRHIPGNATVVVRNMPGAGGIVAAKHLYSSAVRDGTVIGGVQNNVPYEPLFGTKQADYDPNKLNWLGTPSVETGLLFVWHTSKFKTIEDVRKMELTAGASGLNSAPAFYSRVLNELLGTKIKVIAGYPGQNEAYIAIERGELDSFGVTFWSSLTSTKQQWLRDKKVNILVQYGPVKEEELPDVPWAPDMVKNADDRALFEAAYGPLAAGRPYLMPPEIPADRLAAMRKAFMDTFVDEAFKADAKASNLIVDRPRSGVLLQEEIARAYRVSPAIVERLRKIANP